MNKKHTQSANAFAPNAAMSLMRKIHDPKHRHALTPRQSSMRTLDGAIAQCRSLVGLVATTGQMLSAENVAELGRDDKSLVRTSTALLSDLKSFNNKLTDLSTEASQLAQIKDDLDFLPKAVEVGQKLVEWEEQFRQVVLPINGQVHDRITELMTQKELADDESGR